MQIGRFWAQVVFTLFFLFVSDIAQLEANSAAFLISVQGDVLVDGKKNLKAGPIPEGAQLTTGSNGKCTLMVGREMILHLAAQTSLKVIASDIRNRKAEFILGHGKIRALVRSSAGSVRPREFQDVEVRSRAVTLGVRGTQFTVDSPLDRSVPQRFIAIEGEVSLRLPEWSRESPNTESMVPLNRSFQNGVLSLTRGQAFTQWSAPVGAAMGDGGSESNPQRALQEQGRVVTLNAQEIEKEAVAIAPPPRPLATQADFQSLSTRGLQGESIAASDQGSSDGSREGEGRDSVRDIWGEGLTMTASGGAGAAILLDPVLDGGLGDAASESARANVSIVVRKQP